MEELVLDKVARLVVAVQRAGGDHLGDVSSLQADLLFLCWAARIASDQLESEGRSLVVEIESRLGDTNRKVTEATEKARAAGRVCGACLRAFPSQYGFCSWVYALSGKWKVSFGYGSRHDMETWVFNAPPASGTSPLCDECADNMIDDRQLTLENDNDPGCL